MSATNANEYVTVYAMKLPHIEYKLNSLLLIILTLKTIKRRMNRTIDDENEKKLHSTWKLDCKQSSGEFQTLQFNGDDR